MTAESGMNVPVMKTNGPDRKTGSVPEDYKKTDCEQMLKKDLFDIGSIRVGVPEKGNNEEGVTSITTEGGQAAGTELP